MIGKFKILLLIEVKDGGVQIAKVGLVIFHSIKTIFAKLKTAVAEMIGGANENS
jgi:hypothetical protein